jgi:hypothetical protein
LPSASPREIIGGMDDRIVKGEAVDGVGEKAPTRQSYAFALDDDTPDLALPEESLAAQLMGWLATGLFLALFVLLCMLLADATTMGHHTLPLALASAMALAYYVQARRIHRRLSQRG